MRVIVVGAGVGGLALTLALHRLGRELESATRIETLTLERAPSLEFVGALRSFAFRAVLALRLVQKRSCDWEKPVRRSHSLAAATTGPEA